jgi:integrase
MAVVYGSPRIVAISAILWNMRTPPKPFHTKPIGRQKSAAVVQTSPAAHVRRQEQRTIHFLTQDELRQLFKVIRSKRDRAIFLVAYRHGLRASEIGLLQRADVDVKQGRISIHRLKGSISGVYPMQPDVLKTIRSYLRTRTDESPYLFLSPPYTFTSHFEMATEEVAPSYTLSGKCNQSRRSRR